MTLYKGSYAFLVYI